MNTIQTFDEPRKIAIFEKMDKARRFELAVHKAHQSGRISIPIYLGVGQESIAATLSEILPSKTPIFAQHRSHSYFLCFGGDPQFLKAELCSETTFKTNGALGSASIASKEIRMFGHSGLMGDQVPIAVGYALANKELTLAVVGDASVEEDYVLGALGYAATKALPLLLVCEDNNLSILTPKNVRRTWNICDVAKSFGCSAIDLSDDPKEIWDAIFAWDRATCLVLNINTERHLWHSGSGQEGPPVSDRLAKYRESLISRGLGDQIQNIEEENLSWVNSLWK
jgi:pyruvate dehydrogenase E1 component alpha subunit